jgi:hypothetical protein
MVLVDFENKHSTAIGSVIDACHGHEHHWLDNAHCVSYNLLLPLNLKVGRSFGCFTP